MANMEPYIHSSKLSFFFRLLLLFQTHRYGLNIYHLSTKLYFELFLILEKNKEFHRNEIIGYSLEFFFIDSENAPAIHF